MAQVSDELYRAVLNRMNITWVPDTSMAANIYSAIEEAQDFLCDRSGNKDASFSAPARKNLLITCAWYFVENKRADFAREYADELLTLRLEEAFGCGSEENSV